MTKKHTTILGLILCSVFFAGSAFAAEGSTVNTPNLDFNDIGNSLVASGYTPTTTAEGDVLVGTVGDPLASYDGSSGNWVFYND